MGRRGPSCQAPVYGVAVRSRHGALAAYTRPMASRDITDELVSEIVRDLRDRYALDEDELRTVGARIAGGGATDRAAENVAFAERFVAEHRGTFDGLGK